MAARAARTRLTAAVKPTAFLVHAAQRHRGAQPKFMAQPPLDPVGELDLDRIPPSPVERAVLRGLGYGVKP